MNKRFIKIILQNDQLVQNVSTYTSSLAASCSGVASGKALIFCTADLRFTNVAQPVRKKTFLYANIWYFRNNSTLLRLFPIDQSFYLISLRTKCCSKHVLASSRHVLFHLIQRVKSTLRWRIEKLQSKTLRCSLKIWHNIQHHPNAPMFLRELSNRKGRAHRLWLSLKLKNI